jgi:hypothetical protein
MNVLEEVDAPSSGLICSSLGVEVAATFKSVIPVYKTTQQHHILDNVIFVFPLMRT